jgi:hypothetical protein
MTKEIRKITTGVYYTLKCGHEEISIDPFIRSLDDYMFCIKCIPNQLTERGSRIVKVERVRVQVDIKVLED